MLHATPVVRMRVEEKQNLMSERLNVRGKHEKRSLENTLGGGGDTLLEGYTELMLPVSYECRNVCQQGKGVLILAKYSTGSFF